MTDLPALTVEPTFRATAMGLTIIGVPDQAAWAAYGQGLARVARAMQWVIGDWLVFGEKHYGETYAQAASDTGLAPQTLMNMRSVAARVASAQRREHLSFAKHDAVAPLPPSEQDAWLDRSEEEDWNSLELRQAIRESKGAPKLYRVAFTEEELVALADYLGYPDLDYTQEALNTASDKIEQARLTI